MLTRLALLGLISVGLLLGTSDVPEIDIVIKRKPSGTGKISAATIEAGRVVASQSIKAGGKLYIRIFPHKSITSIPAETRMGKGKGEVEYWAAIVKPGTVLYELGGVTEEAARATFARLSYKLPVSCRFITRRPTL